MASQRITLAPLNAVRTAVYDTLAAANLGAGVSLAAESSTAAMPYVVVGPAYKGAGGTDLEWGSINVVCQIDAYASSTQGGAHRVGQMLQAVASALSIEIRIEIDGQTSRPLIVTIEDDVLNPSLQDTLDGPVYAQRYVRFRFSVAL